jgi:hypothetical protein
MSILLTLAHFQCKIGSRKRLTKNMENKTGEIILRAVVAFIVLHLISVASYIPVFFVGLSLEESNLNDQQMEIRFLLSAIVGFVFASIVTVLILNYFAKSFGKRREAFALTITLVMYLGISIIEIVTMDSLATLPSVSYYHMFENISPLVIIPVASVLFYFIIEYIKKTKLSKTK